MSLSVAILSREYPPFFGGGIGTYTEEFSAALAAAGHRVVVVTVSADGREGREDRGGVRVVRLPFINGEDWSGPHASIASPGAVAAFRSFSPVSVFAMQISKALPRLVDEFAIDIVEAPDTGAVAWFALNDRRIGKSCGRRGWPAFITHFHSPTAWIERWDRAPQAGRAHAELKRMERDVVRWADGLVCPSGSLAQWAEGHFNLARGAVEVIRYPLGTLEVLRPSARSRASAPRRILYAGRLEPRKGVDVLLAAFSLAVQRGAELRLDLAGRDILDVRTGRPFGAMCLERLVTEAAQSRIRVHGPLPPEALAALRRESDLAAAPAPSDNFPFTCMEAMASALPVVAARSGGMAEMISGDGDGLLFEPGDVESCAAVLEAGARMTEEELSATGAAARARITSLCGTARVVGERVAHFRSVLTGRAEARSPSEEGAVVIGDGDTEPLVKAVRAGNSFAHGWGRDRGGARVFGTPTLEGLAIGPRDLGPVAVSRAALESPLAPSDWSSPWSVAVALAQRGEIGAVVPDCVNDSGPAESRGLWPVAAGADAVRLCASLGPAIVASLESARRAGGAPDDGIAPWRARADAAEAELSRIKSSRGWRWLNRLYGILHTLKGRGRTGAGR